MLCVSAAYAVVRYLSVCLSIRPYVTFVDSVKTSNRILRLFFTIREPICQTILVFAYHSLYSDIPTGTP